MSPGESHRAKEISMDEVFLKRIKEYVLDNISSEEFSLEALSSEIGYSRSQIHRKLKRITGKSLSTFVREIRLEEANRLLRIKAGTVSDIAYRTGFSSPAYFNKCFSDYFGITPGEASKNGKQIKMPVNITGKKKPASKTSKWGLKVSGIIIGVLLIIFLILAYPRIFGREKSMASMTEPVTFLNESGEKETRQVVKEKYIPRLMIFKFVSKNEDVADKWLDVGVPEGIRIELAQFQYLQVNGNPTFRYMRDQLKAEYLQDQKTISGINNCQYFLKGTCQFTDGNYFINTKLYLTHNGMLERERAYESNDLFTLLDTISLDIRWDLGITEEIINSFSDLPFSQYTTTDIEAYRHFINGIDSYLEGSPSGMVANYYRAIDQDSTFALAAYHLADKIHVYSVSRKSALKYANLADRHRQRLYEQKKVQVKSLKYQVEENMSRSIRLLEMLLELRPSDSNLLLEISDIYRQQLRYAEEAKILARLNKLVPGNTEYQRMLLQSLIRSGRLNKGLRLTGSLLKENPENAVFHFYRGIIYLHKGELDKSENALRAAIEFAPENEEAWSLLFDHIDFLRKNPKAVNLEKFTGQYRSDYVETITTLFIINNHLIDKYGNQWGVFMYPVSDTSFVDADYDAAYNHITFQFNSSGNPYVKVTKQFDLPGPRYAWKENSLIKDAVKLFESDKPEEALVAFKKAYSENPEHYYLEKYIRHLEYMQSQEYIEDKLLHESYTGSYDTRGVLDSTGYHSDINSVRNMELFFELFKEGEHFFIEDIMGSIYRMLPMSQNEFMNTSRYKYTYSFRLEDNEDLIMTLKDKRSDRVFYYLRKNEPDSVRL